MPTTWSTSDKTANIALTGGNLIATINLTGNQSVRSIDKLATGKYYWEVTFTTVVGANWCGITHGGNPIGNLVASTTGSASAALVSTTGGIFVNNVTATPNLGSFTSGAVACFALDLGTSQLWIRNGAAGNWNANAGNNPATGAGGIAVPFGVGLPAYATAGGGTAANGAVMTANFTGTFAGTVPSGFTSGFTSGASIPLYADATQTALELWGQGTPQAQITQVALEMWGPGGTTTPLAITTQVALEQWGVITAIQAQQPRVWIMA